MADDIERVGIIRRGSQIDANAERRREQDGLSSHSIDHVRLSAGEAGRYEVERNDSGGAEFSLTGNYYALCSF